MSSFLKVPYKNDEIARRSMETVLQIFQLLFSLSKSKNEVLTTVKHFVYKHLLEILSVSGLYVIWSDSVLSSFTSVHIFDVSYKYYSRLFDSVANFSVQAEKGFENQSIVSIQIKMYNS